MRSALLGSMLNAHPNGRLLVHEVTDFIGKFESPATKRKD